GGRRALVPRGRARVARESLPLIACFASLARGALFFLRAVLMIPVVSMRVEPSQAIEGVYLVHLQAFGDARGRFFESYRRSWILGAREMVQANRSDSRAGVLRGLHYHLK